MLPYEFSAERFSRWMAYVLRHNPERYGLQPDRHGFVDVEGFLLIAQRRYPNATPERLRSLIEEGGSGRFELTGNRLRARYGHSIAVEPAGPPVEPPQTLYHGTDEAGAAVILRDGLLPKDRRLVHLSENVQDALAIARRRVSQPMVIRIAAKAAHEAGVAFHREGQVYLAAGIPPEFLQREVLA